MSVKERRRLAVLDRVEQGELNLVQAAELMGISPRQAKRIWKRYRELGDAGLVHRLRGRPGNHRLDSALRERAVALYREHYADFGPTLAAEYLAAHHDLLVDDQTLKRWLEAAGLWRRQRKATKRRRRRERRACFGELVQLDGSHHDWFEGRRGKCCLMVMIDDATGWTRARFFEAETTAAAMTMVRDWSLAHGLPRELYPDRHSIYRVNTQEADEIEQRTGKRPPTQMGRALAELGVKLTWAKSPQAKGRVERMNGTLQDRLVKTLRVKGISDIASANVYLASAEGGFLSELNERFAVAPADQTDLHVPVSEAELESALCVREDRVVAQDQCVSWAGRVLQLEPERGVGSLADKRVQVRRGLDGVVTVLWKGRVVAHRTLDARPGRGSNKASLVERVAKHKKPWKPPAGHPWKRSAIAVAGSLRSGSLRSPTLREPTPAQLQGTVLLRE